jgi:hypothetical protein
MQLLLLLLLLLLLCCIVVGDVRKLLRSTYSEGIFKRSTESSETIKVHLSLCLNTMAVWKFRGLITPSRNVVEVRWRSLFLSTSLGKRCNSYNAPPTSRKRAVDRWSLRNFLPRSSIFMVGKAHKSHWERSGLYGGCSNGVPWINFFRTQNWIQISPHAISGLFQPWKGSSEARNVQVINFLQHVFEKWVERCKKCIACRGRYFEKGPSPQLYKVPTRSNKMRPRTLQTAIPHYEIVSCAYISPLLESVWVSGGIAPRILNLCTRWRWVVSFMTQPLYPRGKNPRYPLDRRLGGPENRLDTVVKRKIFLPVPGIDFSRPTRSLVTILPELSQLLWK